MAKPELSQLECARYPFTCTIEPRFGDLDVNMHINNVAMIDILEDARVRFHWAAGLIRSRISASPMIASFRIEYLAQSYYPAALKVHIGIMSVGRTSYCLAHLVTQNDRAVCYGESVMVLMADAASAAIPGEIADSASQWRIRP